MIKEINFKLFILITMILIVQSCALFTKPSKSNNNKSNNYSNEPIKEQPGGEFTISLTKTDTPCWMNTDPVNCPEYKDDSNNYLFITSKMNTVKVSEKLTENQNKDIQKKISFRYFQLLNKIIADELYTNYSQCQEKHDLCKKKFNEYISRQEMLAHHFEIIDKHWSSINGQDELNVLVSISYDKVTIDKKRIITDRILSRLPRTIKIYNDPPTKDIE